MIIPSRVIDDMKDLHFSIKLCGIINRLYNEDYNVNISKYVTDPILDPINKEIILDIFVHKISADTPFSKHFRCRISKEHIDSDEGTEIYNNLADLIYNEVFKTIDDTRPRIFTISKEDASFIKNLKEEINSRGDFVIDVPKFVDILFQLGIMIPKELVEISGLETDKTDIKEL
jgi:hypothetical protein